MCVCLFVIWQEVEGGGAGKGVEIELEMEEMENQDSLTNRSGNYSEFK